MAGRPLPGLADFLKRYQNASINSEEFSIQEEEEFLPFEEEESTISTISFIEDTFTKLQATIFSTVIQESVNKLKILGLIGGLPTVVTTLETQTVLEKLQNEDTQSFIFDPESLEPYEGSLKKQMLIKFQKDRALVELVLEETQDDILKNFSINSFMSRLKQFRLAEEQRSHVLRETQESLALVKRLSTQSEKHKQQLCTELQEKSEILGTLKDEYEDLIYENDIKYRYIDRWEKARCAQNTVGTNQKEEHFNNTIREYYNNTLRENRIHAEIEAFLTETEETHQGDIEIWMEKYDKDLEFKEIEIQYLTERRDEQMTYLTNLTKVYADHKKEIEDYLAEREKRRKRQELIDKMNEAATKIQAWWRGVMYRKGLGPYRKKKGKKGKNGKKKK